MHFYLIGECPLDAIKFSPVVKNIAVRPSTPFFIYNLYFSLNLQVYEQVGELLVHCCYGVMLKDGHTHPVVDTNGTIMSCDSHVTLQLYRLPGSH